MTFDPFKVHAWRRSGNTNIAERIVSATGLVLVCLRAKFAAGTGAADLSIVSVDAMTGVTVSTLHTIPDCGTDGGDGPSVNLTFAREELETGAWTVLPGEILQFNWTNPASGTMTWELEARWQTPNA